MKTQSKPRRRVLRRARPCEPDATHPSVRQAASDAPDVRIPPGDPVLAYFQAAGGPVDIARLELDTPGVTALREAGVCLVVPLVSHGELIGLLNLGPRLSEQEYSIDDRNLLESLAAQAAPALRVAQLVEEQAVEIRVRERYEQELAIAHLIQQNLLPKKMPELEGWHLSAYYRSAREVGGDFYDFIDLPGGRVGIVAGDVTDKGVPAALVMASTRSVLRAAAQRLSSPAEVLARVNDQLCPEMPPKMFVTCLYGVLDPATGHFVYSNAGHNPPYRRTVDGRADELRACGMPLGLMPDMQYEQKEAVIAPGESFLIYSDGLDEAHAPDGDMFGFARVKDIVASHPGGPKLIDRLLADLTSFTGDGWEQEDDITLVAFGRSPEKLEGPMELAAFSVPSDPGTERQVSDRVAAAAARTGLDPGRLEKLKTAVSEAAMNAIEHGNEGVSERPVDVVVSVRDGSVVVRITDQGSHSEVPEAPVPNLEAKLAGEQSPRGWGLFLIRNMVDELNVEGDDNHHTVELVMRIGGDDGGR